MVDPGEQISLTLQREFSEEALNSLGASAAERAKIHDRITKLFNSAGFQVQPRSPSHLHADMFWVRNEDKIKFSFFFFRFIKAMWTIRGTLTMPGWRRLLSTSTMNQVAIVCVFLDTHTCSQAVFFFYHLLTLCFVGQ